MNDIKVPPFTKGQQELIKMTEKLANGRKICDVDDIDDDIKDIKEMLSETIAKIEMKKKTNFARITSSPEALAEFSMRVFKNCTWCLDGGSPKECPFNAFLDCPAESKENMVEWLKQESK